MADRISIQERTEVFAIRVVRAYGELNKKQEAEQRFHLSRTETEDFFWNGVVTCQNSPM